MDDLEERSSDVVDVGRVAGLVGVHCRDSREKYQKEKRRR